MTPSHATTAGSDVARRGFLLGAVAFLVAVSSGTTVLGGEINAVDGVAIKGYDPVAYFTEGRPVPGSAEFTAEHKGAQFRFASAANRDLFRSDPEGYAPQYGGFCAYATANGYKADTDPAAFTVVDGKLYLNYSLSVRTKWSKDIPGNIAKADANWPKVATLTEVVR